MSLTFRVFDAAVDIVVPVPLFLENLSYLSDYCLSKFISSYAAG